ncbi:MAG: hypothetical protein ABI839_08320 [Verrucomicrobiota bacterium]
MLLAPAIVIANGELARQETDSFWSTYGLALAHFATGDPAEAETEAAAPSTASPSE